MAEIIKVVADILQAELSLKNDRVFLYNQKWNIPPDQDLFVVVGFQSAKPFGVKSQYENDPVSGDLVEVQSVNQQETYTIDLISRDHSARMRKQEVILALNSTAAQQAQEQYSFKIANLPHDFCGRFGFGGFGTFESLPSCFQRAGRLSQGKERGLLRPVPDSTSENSN